MVDSGPKVVAWPERISSNVLEIISANSCTSIDFPSADFGTVTLNSTAFSGSPGSLTVALKESLSSTIAGSTWISGFTRSGWVSILTTSSQGSSRFPPST